MKLYYEVGACSLSSMILIEELNLPCEYERVDLKTKQTAAGQNYLAINKKGSVPALQLEDGRVLTENTVIQIFLAERYRAIHLLPELADYRRYEILAWMNYVSTDLHKGCCAILYNAAVDSGVKQTIYLPAFLKKLQLINDHLTNKKFLVGDCFTLADANLFVILTWLPELGISISQFQNLQHYYNNMREKSSIVRAMELESSLLGCA